MNAELPPKTALYVIDNSRRPEFTRSAYEACLQIAAARGLTHLDFSISTLAYPAGASGAEPVLPAALRQRHMHVARLYTGLLPRVSEDLILTLEDDVEPPLDAVRRLGEEIGWTRRGKIGAVAGAYPMAEHPTLVCAGNGKDQWGPAIPWSQLPAGLMDVGCVGGGCTMWANWAIKRSPVNFWWDQHLGWDASLSIQIRRRGYRVRLHGGVRCQHHAHGRIGPTPAGVSPMSISPTSASLAGAAPAGAAPVGILPTGGSRAGVSSMGISPAASWPAGPVYRKQPEGEKVLPPAHNSNFWTTGGLPGRNDAGPTSPAHLNADSWIPEAELGLRIPPYKPTYDFPAFINDRHQALAACPVEAPGTINLGISGWLRCEDALKLYEMAYFSAGNILELGCFQGLSTAILARAVRDSAESKSIVSVDFVANHTYIAQRSLADRGLAGLASFLTGDAGEVCQRLARENRRFSFIFIDHSHRYEDVVRVCRLLPDLLTGEGFCLFHDYNDGRNANPQDENYGVFRAVADTMPPDRFAFYGIYGCAALYRLCP